MGRNEYIEHRVNDPDVDVATMETSALIEALVETAHVSEFTAGRPSFGGFTSQRQWRDRLRAEINRRIPK